MLELSPGDRLPIHPDFLKRDCEPARSQRAVSYSVRLQLLRYCNAPAIALCRAALQKRRAMTGAASLEAMLSTPAGFAQAYKRLQRRFNKMLVFLPAVRREMRRLSEANMVRTLISLGCTTKSEAFQACKVIGRADNELLAGRKLP